MRGIPIYSISQVLDKIISCANGSPLLINGVKRPMPLMRILEVELYPTLLSKARSFGLSDVWIQVWIFLYGLCFHFRIFTFFPCVIFYNYFRFSNLKNALLLSILLVERRAPTCPSFRFLFCANACKL